MEHPHKEEDLTVQSPLSPLTDSQATAADSDAKWIQKELEKAQNQERENPTAQPASPADALSAVIEKIPFERLIEGAIGYFTKQSKKKKKKKSRKRRKK